MANEINVSTQLSCENAGYQAGPRSLAFRPDQANAGGIDGLFKVTTAAEVTLPIGTVQQFGWLWIQNLDSANYIQWGFATGVYGGRILAGEAPCFRLEPAQTLYMIANTADVNIQYLLLEA